MSKTVRRPYRQSRAFDGSCRSHGGCPWCYGNRMHGYHRQLARALASLREWWTGDDA